MYTGEAQTISRSAHDEQFMSCFGIETGSTYLVENRTPYDIQIDHGSHRLIVPGLATDGCLACVSGSSKVNSLGSANDISFVSRDTTRHLIGAQSSGSRRCSP